MADVLADGNTRVAWVPAISNQNAPTTAELGAGILLQNILTADGLNGFQPETQSVDNTSLASTFGTSTIGRDNYSNTMLRFKKQDGTDTAYNTLTRGASGYLVIRRDVAEGTAWTTGQAVEVYPVICGQTSRLNPEPNSVAKYEVMTLITSPPSLRASVA